MRNVKKSAADVERRRKDGKRDRRFMPNNGRGGGRKFGIKVLNVKTGVTESHHVEWFLRELNHHRNDDWIPFTAKDWRNGWEAYIDKRQYKLINKGEAK